MPRLRRADCASPGLSRRRRGRGFSYVDERGQTIRDVHTLERINGLAIPPAWRDVWICPDPNGHLQAVGTDQAGRRQYLYHPQWRARRDRKKFDETIQFAHGLPKLRTKVAAYLAGDELSRERVLAGAIRLLDRGLFRVGNEEYTEENGTYGLATIEKRHVQLGAGNLVVFDYVGKSDIRHVHEIVDPEIHRIAQELKRRRGGGTSFLAFREGRWMPVRAEAINGFIKEHVGPEFSAKHFRTWHATAMAAAALARQGDASTAAARTRAINRVVSEIAASLGNTPQVCRASYIDSRIFDSYRAGDTITISPSRKQDSAAAQASLEAAVLRLLAPN